MKLYRTKTGCFIEHNNAFYPAGDASWDSLITRDDLEAYLNELVGQVSALDLNPLADPGTILPPIGSQEVWAAGVTYFRSRAARMDEAKSAGGGDFYDRVYRAERPELFFKATAGRVAGPGSHVRSRSDAKWSVPEPELTLLTNHRGQIIGYTVGNDMSSRDIEGENPLYLPQAKVYDRSCALGPCVLISVDPLPSSTAIQLEILRGGATEFTGVTTLAEMKRKPATLA